MELWGVLLSGFAAAAIAPVLLRLPGGRGAAVLALVPLAITVYFGRQIGVISSGETIVAQVPWVPRLDLSASLMLDGLGLLFALIIAGVGTLVTWYSGGYLAGHPRQGRFFAAMLAFMAAMLGLVLAGNVLTLYAFWELTTFTSFLLIGFENHRESARSAAIQALLVTAFGGLALLAGLVLLGIAGESFELAELLSRGEQIRASPLYPSILALVLLGALTKSAQFPFHFWLPNAMEAPTPVSAYLHSATMVKAGVYLLMRMLPILGGTELWLVSVTSFGAVTMFVGAYLAYFRHDIKAVLAYLTINVLGTLVMLLGLGTEVAIKAALVYLVAHALYKGALFLVAGAVDHETHCRDLRSLSGLGRRMPATAAAAVLAALSMAGVLPLFGFVAKELYLKAVWESPSAAIVLTVVSVASSALLVAGSVYVGLRPFFGAMSETAEPAREASLAFWLCPAILALAGLWFGLFPQTLAGPPVEPAAAAVRGSPLDVDLKPWHGITVPLTLSVAALVAGLGLDLLRRKVLGRVGRGTAIDRWGPEAGYDAAVRGLQWVATKQTRLLQSGYLRLYVVTILATMVVLAVSMWGEIGEGRLRQESIGIRFYEVVAAGLAMTAALLAVRSTSRYRAVAALGVVGISVAWIYLLFGAPDLAMTQIVVEVLTVLLFVLAFPGLPAFRELSDPGTRLRDGILAVSVGGMMTLLLLLATGFQRQTTVSSYFAEASYLEAHGRNVVNVILVDFRALDTLGEVTVLATAATGVYTLIRLVLPKEDSD